MWDFALNCSHHSIRITNSLLSFTSHENFPHKNKKHQNQFKIACISPLTMNCSKNISIKFIMDPLMPRYTAGLSPINVFVQFFRYSQIWFHWIQMSFFTSRQPGWWWKRKKKVLPICVIRKLIIKCESWTLFLKLSRSCVASSEKISHETLLCHLWQGQLIYWILL